MSQKAMKVVIELNLRAVTCPGVHLPAKDDVYLTVCLTNQYRKSECLPAVFPLLFREKIRFEKTFKYAIDPAEIAEILQCESVRVELIQLTPPVGEVLASFEEDARSFLFPEPKLVPSFSGVDREVLMTRDPTFPGISPRLEFSTKTTISDCSERGSNLPLPVSGRNQTRGKKSQKRRPISPQKRLFSSMPWRQRGHQGGEWAPLAPRSRSLSPYTASLLEGSRDNSSRLARLGQTSESLRLYRTHSNSEFTRRNKDVPGPVDEDRASSPRRAPAGLRPATLGGSCPRHPSSPTGAGRRQRGRSNGLLPGDSCSSDTDDLLDYVDGRDRPRPLTTSAGNASPASLWRRQYASSVLRSANVWEEVQERVRNLLTSPQAVHRLTHGATHSEIDEVLARRSVLPRS